MKKEKRERKQKRGKERRDKKKYGNQEKGREGMVRGVRRRSRWTRRKRNLLGSVWIITRRGRILGSRVRGKEKWRKGTSAWIGVRVRQYGGKARPRMGKGRQRRSVRRASVRTREGNGEEWMGRRSDGGEDRVERVDRRILHIEGGQGPGRVPLPNPMRGQNFLDGDNDMTPGRNWDEEENNEERSSPPPVRRLVPRTIGDDNIPMRPRPPLARASAEAQRAWENWGTQTPPPLRLHPPREPMQPRARPPRQEERVADNRERGDRSLEGNAAESAEQQREENGEGNSTKRMRMDEE